MLQILSLIDTPDIAGASLFVFVAFVILAIVALTIIPYWVILQKAGFSGWLSLLMLVPLVNAVLPWIFAFSEWPALKRLEPVAVEPGPPQLPA